MNGFYCNGWLIIVKNSNLCFIFLFIIYSDINMQNQINW
jgi:hypothetical protein